MISHRSLEIPGFTGPETDRLNQLIDKLARHRAINETRKNYDEAKQGLKSLGIAIPPHLTEVSVALEWPRAAWKHLADRVNFEGFTLIDGEPSDFGIDRIVQQNRLLLEAPMVEAEAFKYGPAFVLTLAGGHGEPPVVQRGLSPRTTTVLWDANRRQVSAMLTVTATAGWQIKELIYADTESVLTATLEGNEWRVVRTPVGIGRCPVSVLPSAPDLENPLGRSRISQGVMATTDRAMRTLLRMEITAEFFSAPQRYLLGADSDAFVDESGNPMSGWSSLIGRWNMISRDEDGEIPSIWQAPQASMQPHIDMLRSDAGVLSGLTNVPIGALGVVHDNPASDAAMHTAYLALNKDAENAVRTFGAGRVDAMQVAVMIRDGLTEMPDELWGLEAKYRPVATPTQAAAADAMAKEIGALPWVGETEVALEGFGHDRPTIDRLMAAKRRQAGSASLSAILDRANPTSDGNADPAAAPAPTLDAKDLRDRFEALGIAIRSGVDPEDAARRLGLDGINFTGAVPVSLRQPETPGREA